LVTGAALGKVFEQDTFNMERVQLGLESTRKPGVTTLFPID